MTAGERFGMVAGALALAIGGVTLYGAHGGSVPEEPGAGRRLTADRVREARAMGRPAYVGADLPDGGVGDSEPLYVGPYAAGTRRGADGIEVRCRVGGREGWCPVGSGLVLAPDVGTP